MLQQVILNAPVPMTFDLDTTDSEDIIIVKSISGLDSVDVNLFTGEFARGGGYYQGRRPGKRNPVFDLKLNPNYKEDVEVSDIRELLYSLFLEPSPGREDLQVILKDDRKPDRYFVGYTEKFPSNIFEKDTTAQISMLCTDSFLYSVDAVVGSDPVGYTTLPLAYEGSVRTGLVVKIKIKTATPQLIVDINGTAMILNMAMVAGDVIDINTVEGSRYIRRNGQDVMNALVGSNWLGLSKGINTIRAYGSTPDDGKAVLTDYEYRGAWWGI